MKKKNSVKFHRLHTGLCMIFSTSSLFTIQERRSSKLGALSSSNSSAKSASLKQIHQAPSNKKNSCSTQLSKKFQLLVESKIRKNNDFSCTKHSDVGFIQLINVKMPTIVGILTFISKDKFHAQLG